MYDLLLSGSSRVEIRCEMEQTGRWGPGGKLLESRRPPPRHGIPPRFDEIIYVNVCGSTHANDSSKDERGLLDSPGQVELGDLRELQPSQREGETCSRSQFTHKKGDRIVFSGSRSPLLCLKRRWRKRTSLRGGREVRGAKAEPSTTHGRWNTQVFRKGDVQSLADPLGHLPTAILCRPGERNPDFVALTICPFRGMNHECFKPGLSKLRIWPTACFFVQPVS